MKILLIRHGESTGNRDHIWAGITDNELTSHGFLQATRLGEYLERQLTNHTIQAVYCSDLIRATRTAQQIANKLSLEVNVSKLLREQDLGWREGRAIKDGDKTSPKNAEVMKRDPGESKSDMDIRARAFIVENIQAHVATQPQLDANEHVVIVVSHGLFLSRLYYQLTSHLKIPHPPAASWSNTGCTTFSIQASGITTVTDINSVQHLQGLKRTRAGVGSAKYDTTQKKVSDFFGTKRLKLPPAERTIAQSGPKTSSERELEPRQGPASTEGDELELELEAQIRAIDAACNNAVVEKATADVD